MTEAAWSIALSEAAARPSILAAITRQRRLKSRERRKHRAAPVEKDPRPVTTDDKMKF
jgi:hypothetical protein